MNINIVFLLLALLAEIVGTIGGFGSSVFFVPIGTFFFDFHSVLGLTAIFHLSSNISKIYLFKQGLNKKLLINIGVPSVIFVTIGAYISQFIQTTFLEIILGVFLIGFSLFFIVFSQKVISPNRKNAIIGGVFSGFSAGLLGTGGAIRGLTMAAFNLSKNTFIATSAFIDFMIDLTRSVVYFNNGYIHAHDLKYVPFLFVIGVVGTYFGKKILHFIPQDKFRMLSLILILIVGGVTLYKYILK